MPEGVGGVAKLAESSAIGYRPEHPPFIRGNAESSANEELEGQAPGFACLKPTVAVRSEPGGRDVYKRVVRRRPRKESMWLGGENLGARIARKRASLGVRAPAAAMVQLKGLSADV